MLGANATVEIDRPIRVSKPDGSIRKTGDLEPLYSNVSVRIQSLTVDDSIGKTGFENRIIMTIARRYRLQRQDRITWEGNTYWVRTINDFPGSALAHQRVILSTTSQ